MTREQLRAWWRNLRFWQRALLECLLGIFVYVLVDLIFDGRTMNLGWAIFKGTGLGLFYAVIDHAVFVSRRKRANRGTKLSAGAAPSNNSLDERVSHQTGCGEVQ